jgi:hypothetical protein
MPSPRLFALTLGALTLAAVASGPAPAPGTSLTSAGA